MSDDDSSSEDDVPLSSLSESRRKSRGSVNYNEESDGESEAEFQDEDDEEEFEDEEEAPDDDADNGMDTDDFIADDDSSDEDKPLSSLKSPKKTTAKKAPAKKAPAKKKTPAKKKKEAASPKKKKATPKLTKSKSNVSSASSKPGSTYKAPSIELYTNCDKGKLIQSVLVRWWYVYTWPDAASLPKSTPKNYTALDGFPGVYICTAGSDVGKFKDYRDHSTAPSFKNFARKTASELKEMLLKAISNQRTALRTTEGEGTQTEKDLRELEKWANKLNCVKADKEAEKVLKAAKLVLS